MKTHKNMNMMILHQEYLEKYPDGLKYTLIPISKFFSYQIS
jgi:hypothetical protein